MPKYIYKKSRPRGIGGDGTVYEATARSSPRDLPQSLPDLARDLAAVGEAVGRVERSEAIRV